jgi:peptidoglycan/LPS O-acetylase OafA/YrhL
VVATEAPRGAEPAIPAAIHTGREARLESLTGVRFFAALAVVLNHYSIPGAPAWVNRITNSGYNGVTIFFVLSGFVIAYNYFDQFRIFSPRVCWNFFVARVARIYPLYVCVLLFVWLNEYGQPSSGNLAVHLFTLQAWSSNVHSAFALNSPGWSIGVEFFMYLSFPLLVPLLVPIAEKIRALWAVAAAVSASMFLLALVFVVQGWSSLPAADPQSAHRWLYRTPLTRLGDFTLGIVAALLYLQLRRSRGQIRVAAQAATVLALATIIGLMALPANNQSALSWDVAYSLPAFVLYLGLSLAPGSPIARFLSSGTIILLGEASYALYLIQFPAKWWYLTIASSDVQVPEAVQQAQWLMFLMLIVCLSIGLHVFFERPTRRWLRRKLSLPVMTPVPRSA